MRFKVGNKVALKKGLKAGKKYGALSLSKTMIFDGFKIVEHESENGNYWLGKYYYSPEMLMPYEFSKSDLKDGMLCQMRDGEKMIWLYGKMRGITSLVGETYDDLKSPARYCDIVKVGYPSEKAGTIEEMIQMNFGKVIWIRKEEPTVKEFSMDEINEILKEKFPDVDEFKINTKE